MEESLRLKRQQTKDYVWSLPPVDCSERPLKQIYNTENAFKLCKVGVRKSKFINFDLKYSLDENAKETRLSEIKIPLLIYNKNKFSPSRQKSNQKSPRFPSLTIAKRVESMPSVIREGHPKFTKSNQDLQYVPNMFIT